MQVKSSSDKQPQLDPEWIREFANFLDKNGNKEKFEVVKKVFVETYLENVREGMNPKDALQKAKSVALCFLLLQQ
jgi:hypothetical protein